MQGRISNKLRASNFSCLMAFGNGIWQWHLAMAFGNGIWQWHFMNSLLLNEILDYLLKESFTGG